MRVDTKTAPVSGAGRGRSELWLANGSSRRTNNWRGITQVTWCVERGLLVSRDSWGCERLASGCDSFRVDMTDVVGIGACLETTLNDKCWCECINFVGLGLRFRVLRAHVSHQRLSSRMHVFIIVFSEDLLMHQSRILRLLSKRRREERHLHRQQSRHE